MQIWKTNREKKGLLEEKKHYQSTISSQKMKRKDKVQERLFWLTRYVLSMVLMISAADLSGDINPWVFD